MEALAFKDMLKAGRLAKKLGLKSAWDRRIYLEGFVWGARKIIKKNKEEKWTR